LSVIEWCVLKPIFIFPLPGTQVLLGHFAGEWIAITRLPREWKAPKENKFYPLYFPKGWKGGGWSLIQVFLGFGKKIRVED